MADHDAILDKSRKLLVDSFASGGGEEARAGLLGNQLVQLLQTKHDNDLGNDFRDEVRTFGLALKKDNTALRDQLMYNQVDLKTVVDNGKEGLRSEAQAAEITEMQQDNLRESIGVDEIRDFPAESDYAEGEVKGSMQPKIAGLEGIEFVTGNS